MRTKKPSKAEQLAQFVRRNHVDLSSAEVTTRLTTLYTTIKDTEQDATQLQAKLTQLRARLTQDRATATGLELVLAERRQ